MARILVLAPDTVAAREASRRVEAALREDGQDAVRLTGDPLAAIPDADALVALLDGSDARTAAGVAAAAALDKPVLALVGPDSPRPVQHGRVEYHAGVDLGDWLVALPAFSASVRPFAGRLVRDLIPQLVRDAGHEVSFRAAEGDERARYLKEKVLHEAQALLAAGVGQEKEEIGDLLEALEALIRVRSYDREALKRVKEAKRRERGGFERCWVVESTTPRASHGDGAADPADDHAADDPADDEGATEETDARPADRGADDRASRRAARDPGGPTLFEV